MGATPVSFNPTATAVLADNDNKDEVIAEMRTRTGNPEWTSNIDPGFYYVAFMGDVKRMAPQTWDAARGAV